MDEQLLTSVQSHPFHVDMDAKALIRPSLDRSDCLLGWDRVRKTPVLKAGSQFAQACL
jgi:hypothetical protein